MSRPPKGLADLVVFNDRQYLPQYPPSEQIDALVITQALSKLERKKAAGTKINETSLRSFTQIYPRLYQVPNISQARFRTWMDKNEETIQGWDVGDFFKTPDDDARDHTEPREPGCPDEVMDAWKSAVDGQQKTDQASVNQEPPANGSDNNNASAEIYTFMGQESERAMPSPPTGCVQGSEQGYQGITIQTFEASWGKIKEVASRLEQLSDNFHLEDGDSVKEQLLALAHTIHTNVDSTSRARKIISQQIGKGAVSKWLRKKRRLNIIADTEGGYDENKNEDEDEGPRRVRARRSTSDLASLKTDSGLIREHGTFDRNLSDGSITDAFGNDQNSAANNLSGPQDDAMELDIDPRLLLDPYQLHSEESSVGHAEEQHHGRIEECIIVASHNGFSRLAIQEGNGSEDEKHM